ncbi:hypothetical protein [Ktedonobacter robiniae]|uniref:Uncharacterized protein n=1 Tax=Ktedonobacter robiniae TaxID=2778365 RepID=A0ABQ3UI18_9CHLR|nr:hypothetical protein [Ktedonobacter robiniae]GHO52356.1 hypothetical protein KSB_08310 [Ktedonobacter robiniae]
MAEQFEERQDNDKNSQRQERAEAHIEKENQEIFPAQGDPARYSYRGPHGDYQNDQAESDPDGYGLQDQFGDLDNQDPYSNLTEGTEDERPENDDVCGDQDMLHTATGEPLYGLEEPLAKPGEESRQGSDRDRYGTKGSQDQYGYQK